MPNEIIDRLRTEALIDTEISNQIFKNITQQSVALKVMKKLPNMSAKERKMRVLDSLPEAYWVDGDTGLKGTTAMEWKNKFITAEEIAVIVPIPESVVADVSIDLMGEVRPLVEQAFAQKIDEAILMGEEAPASWGLGLVDLARNHGHVVKLASTTNYNDFHLKTLGEDGVLAKIESDGYLSNGILADVTVKSKLRGATNKDGDPVSVSTSEIDGIPINYVMNGTWKSDKVLMLAGDFNKSVYAIRQDLTMKLFTEGTITDNSGKVLYNLMQQDMVALRFVMRLGWTTINPVSVMNEDESTRFPFSILQKSSDPTIKTVTFTVYSDASVTPVVGAEVSFAGLKKKTNSSGKAVFETTENIKTGTKYTVKKDDVKIQDVIDESITANKSITVANFV